VGHVSLPAALFGLAPGAAWAEAGRTRLFIIARSKNENVVCYDWVTDSGKGRLDVYWRMNAERGQREELTGLERDMAYGYRVLGSTSSGELSIALKAAPKRPIAIDRSVRPPVARATIASSQATLESIYVSTREGGILPSVLYIELAGRLPTGKAVSERIER